MYDYSSEAIVLTKEGNGDMDSRVSLFTEKFGKVTGRATSARKITSKLAAHLEPGILSAVRFAEKNNFQITDALRIGKTGLTAPNLHYLNLLIPEWQPDRELWEYLLGGEFSWRTALALLGWDPRDARCLACGRTNDLAFHLQSQEFFCRGCASAETQDALLYIS